MIKAIAAILGLALFLYVAYHIYLIGYTGANPFQ
jgi:hypothetical protein